MKRLIAVLSLSLVACSTVPTPRAPAPVDRAEARAPQVQLLKEASWSLQLPADWEVQPSVMDEETHKVIAAGHVEGSKVVLAISSLKLDDDIKDEEFGEVAVGAMQSMGVKVLDAKRATIDGKPGTAVLVDHGDGITTFEYAVAAGRTGHLAVCGGRVSVTILQRCKEILDTLKLR